jgi:uncharacterized membrane protein
MNTDKRGFKTSTYRRSSAFIGAWLAFFILLLEALFEKRSSYPRIAKLAAGPR